MGKGPSLAILLSLFTCAAQAVEAPHQVEVRGVFGGVDASVAKGSSTERLNDVSTGHFGLSYSYAIHHNFTLGIEKLSGDTESFVEITDLFTDSKLDYDLLNLVALARYPVTQRGTVYAKVMATKYDYDVFDDGKVVGSGDGNDIGFGVGWRYTFDSNISLSLGFESMSMGDDIDLRGISWSVGYRF